MCIHCKMALDVLVKEYGEAQGAWLLWNETCFPFDGVKALMQAKDFIVRDKRR
jgi:hypothetical protein